MYDIIAQIFGFAGAGFLMISFQMKKSNSFFACQTIGSGLFLINYLMLGAWTGALISIMSVTRSSLIAVLKGRSRYVIFPILLAFPVIAGFFIYTGIETVLMIAAYVLFTASMFGKNSKLIRITQLFVASPLQLIHNVIVFSLGGILCESFNILSIIVSFFRLGFKNFQSKGEKESE